MLKMVQPYDIFLANPHISASGIIGNLLPSLLTFLFLKVHNPDKFNFCFNGGILSLGHFKKKDYHHTLYVISIMQVTAGAGINDVEPLPLASL